MILIDTPMMDKKPNTLISIKSEEFAESFYKYDYVSSSLDKIDIGLGVKYIITINLRSHQRLGAESRGSSAYPIKITFSKEASKDKAFSLYGELEKAILSDKEYTEIKI